jgi:hypothetical protein
MKSAPTPETDALRDEIWDTPYRDGDDFSKMLDHAKKLERERDNAMSDWRQADTDSIRALHERNEAREMLSKALIRGDLALEETAKTRKKLLWSDYQDKRETQRKLDAARAEIDEIHATGGCSYIELQKVTEQRDEARQQRDRLAEALRGIANGTNCQECGGEDQARFAREVLQSITNQPK